jgi:hypothetical protein
VSSSASYASDQHVQYNHRAQDTHGPTPLAASNPQAQLADISAMPESHNTPNPEGLDPADPGVCYSVVHETGNGTEAAHDGHAHGTYQLDGIGETRTGLRRQSQVFPRETSGQHSPTTIASLTPGDSSASSPSLAVVQGPDAEEVQQGSRRQLSTHGDPSSTSEKQPHLGLSGLAEEALAAVVQATSGRDLEFPAGFGAGRPSSSVSAQPSATLSSQARARVPLPPLSELLSGVGQERASERDLSPGTSLPTFDSLRASRDHRAPQPSLPRTGLLPRLLPRPKNHNHDNERSPNDSHGLYSCPECGQGFNRMVIMERHRARHGINPQRELFSSRSGTAGTTTSSPSP